MTRFAVWPYFKKIYLSSTPRFSVGKSSNGWQRISSTGISPLRGSHTTAPIACDGFTPDFVYHARTVAGREYHYPYCLSLPHRELPNAYRLLLLAPCRADRGAVSNVAYAHHNSNRKVFDEWVFGCQGTTHSPLYKRKTGKGLSVVLHLFPH